MSRKNNVFRIKIEFENNPITDVKVNGISEFNKVIDKVKKKFRGGL